MHKPKLQVNPYLIDDFLEALREIEDDLAFTHEGVQFLPTTYQHDSVQFLRMRLTQVEDQFLLQCLFCFENPFRGYPHCKTLAVLQKMLSKSIVPSSTLPCGSWAVRLM